MSSVNLNMPQIMLHANTAAELIEQLALLDIDVPERSEGRRNHHAERYCIAHLLATLPIERFSFPLSVIHSDRPDFLLSMRDGDVGVEHTEAVPENVARADFLREKGTGPDVYFIPRATPGEPRKTAEELRREIQADAPGNGWEGDSPERQWAVAMAYYIGEKLRKANADGFTRYSSNWLIVYDNWPLPAVSYFKAIFYLAPLLRGMDAFTTFESIFVHNDSQIVEFGGEPLLHKLVKPSDINKNEQA